MGVGEFRRSWRGGRAVVRGIGGRRNLRDQAAELVIPAVAAAPALAVEERGGGREGTGSGGGGEETSSGRQCNF